MSTPRCLLAFLALLAVPAAAVLLLILILWLRRSTAQPLVIPPQTKKQAPPLPAGPPAFAAAEVSLTPDDLKLIEGIGPKISGILEAAAIVTFSQLASADVDRLRQILDEAGFRAPADPTTWPEQASLAAQGDWDGLKALQAQLRGGRRA